MFTNKKIINKELLSVKIPNRCKESECPLKTETEKILKELKHLCIENKVDKVLINTCANCTLAPDVWGQFKLGEKFAKIINGSGIRTGIYGNGNGFTPFTETVAVNRGSTIKVSNDKDEILEWLDLDAPLSSIDILKKYWETIRNRK